MTIEQSGEPTASPGALKLDVAIVGAGFAGLYMLHKLRGMGLSCQVLEAGSGVGGTWFWNRYPGARVDIESQEYSYSFSKELEEDWRWGERYAAQPELLNYLNHVADRFDLRRDIRFDTRVASASFDESANRWSLVTQGGSKLSAQFCVMATGCLSAIKDPDFAGMEDFKGLSLHTGRWPHEGVNLHGKTVGVIGTGSSGIQTLTEIAGQAERLFVFQRTPNFSVPAHNGPVTEDARKAWLAAREENRTKQRNKASGILAAGDREVLAFEVSEEERRRVYEECWAKGGFALGGAFVDTAISEEANEQAAEFVRSKIRAIVKDPAVAEKLTPHSFPIMTKRLCVDTGYFEIFNRANVTLVDLNAQPIETVTPTGVKTKATDFDLDVIIYATGFDAMTGALDKIEIKGRGGQGLKKVWKDGPRTYLGLMVADFPNLFLVTGPGSPSVLSNMVVSIEQHVEWISDCIGHVSDRQLGVIEATRQAQDLWVEHVNDVAGATLYPKANSWYLGANVPGKPRVFMPYIGGVPLYRERCDAVAGAGYEGFTFSKAVPEAAHGA